MASTIKDAPEGTIDTKSVLYKKAEREWQLIVDLLQGTTQMRLQAGLYIPKEPKEGQTAYDNRVKRSFLYNGVRDTLNKHASRPFSRAVTQAGEEPLPPVFRSIWDNVDLTGQNMDDYSKSVFTQAEKFGLTHIFVDFMDIGTALTKAEEEATGNRPVFINVSREDLIFWRTRQGINGMVLSEVRFREFRTEPDGTHGDMEVEYIRVVREAVGKEKGTWEVHRKHTDSGDWELKSRGEHSYPDGLPWVTIYFDRSGFMEAGLPLSDLADLNLRHFQSFSDQTNILRFARLGLLFGAGFTQEEADKGFVVSVNEAVVSINDKATLEYVEISGESIKAGERDLQSMEERMEVLGLHPLIARHRDSTATGAKINDSKGVTIIQHWVRQVESGILKAYQVAEKWLNENNDNSKIPEDFKVDIYDDFGIGGDTNENELLLNSCIAGKLATRDYIDELKRRNTLNPSQTTEKFLENIKVDPIGFDDGIEGGGDNLIGDDD